MDSQPIYISALTQFPTASSYVLRAVFMLMIKQVKFLPRFPLYHWEQPGLKGSVCCMRQLTTSTGTGTLHMQLHGPFLSFGV